MNGVLPGLLDDPNLNTLSLPTFNDVHIAPLRNPAPSRNGKAPLPLELIDSHHATDSDRSAAPGGSHDNDSRLNQTHSTPHDPHSASKERETKKPHLAISELVDTPVENELGQIQLPSFVSLSVVEKSPTQKILDMNNEFPNKRLRLDVSSRAENETDRLLLPRPIQKDDRNIRPLLPAMVTGLHEPPPSAAILPSMDPDARPTLPRASTTVSKMNVKDMLSETQRSSHGRPPEQMLNTPEVASAELPKSVPDTELPSTEVDTPSTTASVGPSIPLPVKDKKLRRIRRKWTVDETDDLLAGVQKHGPGKWKQILNDPTYTFIERTSIDLKDRYRVFSRPEEPAALEVSHEEDGSGDPSETSNKLDTVISSTRTLSSMDNGSGSSQPTRQRRKRHPWTREEDNALLAGVQKYGFQWTDIHNDVALKLSHRRATDLRDRIRNLYPDGYKHAEARPLRAEVKKAEKAGKKETPAGVLYAPSTQMDSIGFASTTTPAVSPTKASSSDPSPSKIPRRQTTDGRVPSVATLTATSADTAAEREVVRPPRRSKTTNESDPAGITLPSLALDVSGDAEGWDNTLPPFINWEA